MAANKPIGQYEIDWSHPLARGLQRFWVHELYNNVPVSGSFGVYPNVHRDLVNGHLLSNGEYATGRGISASVLNGEVTLIPDSTYFSIKPVTPIVFTDSEPFTFAARSIQVASATRDMPFGLYNSSGGIWNRWGSYVRLYGDSGSESLPALTKPDSTITLLLSSDGLGTSLSNLNAYQHETSESVSKSLCSSGCTFNFLSSPDQNEVKNNVYWAVWNRELSLDEKKAFSENPYQFLKPVRTVQQSDYAALFSSGVSAITGTASGSFTPITGNTAGTVVNPVTGTADGSLSNVTGSASGTVVGNITGIAVGTLTPVTGSASGVVLSTSITGTIDGSLASITGAGTGVAVNPVSGTASGTLTGITGSASGLVVGDVTLTSLAAQITALQAQVALLIELNGLDPLNPHTITPVNRYSTNIDIGIVDNGDSSVTLIS